MELKDARLLVTPTSFGRQDLQLRAYLEATVGSVQCNPFNRPMKAAELIEMIPSEETRGMVDKAFLAAMKPGSILINTARVDVIHDEALLNALERGHLAGAALDVYKDEPPGEDNPLMPHPHIRCTPHMGSHTDASMNAMGWMALEDCLAVLKGEQPSNVI